MRSPNFLLLWGQQKKKLREQKQLNLRKEKKQESETIWNIRFLQTFYHGNSAKVHCIKNLEGRSRQKHSNCV